MNVTAPTHADWIYAPGCAGRAARSDRLEAGAARPRERARRGRGGLPIAVAADENQAIWIEIYTGRNRPAGVYRGTIAVNADGTSIAVPIELELFDFALPDENSMHAMVYYEGSQPELYHGRNLDPAYHRFAHRHRIELVHALRRTSRAGGGRPLLRATTSRARTDTRVPARAWAT